MNLRKIGSYLACIALYSFLYSCAPDEGAVPTDDNRDNYTGSWLCDEKPSNSSISSKFTISISKSGQRDTIRIFNFNNIGKTFYALAKANGNSLIIPSQFIDGDSVTGSGNLQANKLNLNYNVISAGKFTSYTANCTR